MNSGRFSRNCVNQLEIDNVEKLNYLADKSYI